MALLDNIEQVAFTSLVPTDLILGTFSGSVSSPSPGSGFFPTKTTTTASIVTGINEKTFFQGVFSVDGGTTWCDFNSNITLNLGAYANIQTQMMYGASSPGVLRLSADNWSKTSDGINFSGSAYTFMYKVVLFAKPDQGDVSAQTVVQQQNFNSFYNYQKIFRDSIFPFSFPVGTSTAVITHNLGYVPLLRMYVDSFSPSGDTYLYDFGFFLQDNRNYQVYMDANTINIYIDNSAGVSPITGTLYTRIYYADE